MPCVRVIIGDISFDIVKLLKVTIKWGSNYVNIS